MTSRSFGRRSFLKTIGTAALAAPFVTRGWAARSPNSVLRHASFGASGMAGHDIYALTRFREVDLVAVAEVDLERVHRLRQSFPGARIYQDWRQLLDKEAKRIDSVNVSTPDHMHAVMAMSALQLGKHVYCQKPLAHDLHEVRKLTEAASQRQAVTQMGIQIHATSYYKLARLLVQAGAIGRVKEAHAWCPTSWGDPAPLPNKADPVPAELAWDLWLGVCEARPYIGNGYYHPVNWRKRLDFGTGSLGDMGCHIFDPIFCALGLSAPVRPRLIRRQRSHRSIQLRAQRASARLIHRRWLFQLPDAFGQITARALRRCDRGQRVVQRIDRIFQPRRCRGKTAAG